MEVTGKREPVPTKIDEGKDERGKAVCVRMLAFGVI
jgi:hypothetical protein